MQRELTLEETKKYEIYVKALKLITSNRPAEESGGIEGLSNEELLAAMKSMGNS